MSFSFSHKGTAAEARSRIEQMSGAARNGQVPLPVRIYLLENLLAFKDDEVVDVTCHGHQRGAWPGDTNAGSATVIVKLADA